MGEALALTVLGPLLAMGAAVLLAGWVRGRLFAGGAVSGAQAGLRPPWSLVLLALAAGLFLGMRGSGGSGAGPDARRGTGAQGSDPAPPPGLRLYGPGR